MTITYYKLLDLINRKHIRKTDLLKSEKNPNGITAPTLAKISKNQTITTETIDKLCTMLDCQPGDIMEYERTSNKIVHPDGSTTFIIEQPPKKHETKTFTVEAKTREEKEVTKYNVGNPERNTIYSFKKDNKE